ncbi:MAG: carbohydrate ABC transporter permease [Eubacteriales bacterium]|nr:carbohydrate ABC transporter permease [Eubacteriales bacterium]
MKKSSTLNRFGSNKVVLTLVGIALFVFGLFYAYQGLSVRTSTRKYTERLGVDTATLIEIKKDVEELGADYKKSIIEKEYNIKVGKLSLKSIPSSDLIQFAPWKLAIGIALMLFGLLLPKVPKYILIYMCLFVVCFPFMWMVLASFKNNVDIIDASRSIFESEFTFNNYITVFDKYNFIRPTINSFYVGLMATLIGLVIGLPAAYAISEWHMYKTSLVILIVRMIPGITFLVPWYILFLKMGITNTFTALIMSHMLITLPFIIWVMVPFFDNVPQTLEEAAWVDGSPRWRSFFTIVLPVSIPGIMTASLLAFIFSWNNFMFSLVLTGAKTTTLPIAIYGFVGYAAVDWGGLMAAAVFITLPIIVLSLLMQQYIISGLTAGAVKG